MIAAFSTAGAIARHDLREELRRPVAAVGVLLFGTSSLVTLHLALAGGGRVTDGMAAGALWIVLVYGALLGTARALGVEREEGTWDALLLAPADRSSIFLGKVLSAALLTIMLHAVLVPLYALLFAAPSTAAAVAVLAVAVVLADVGFALVGVLLGSLGMHSRGRELLTASMFLPLVLPLVIAATTASLHAYGAAPDAQVARLLGFLVLYDATFLAIGIAALPEVAVD